MDAIYSGTPWFDQNGNIVSAHGANIVRGQWANFIFLAKPHTDDSNAFAGFNCYSSKDLYNWKFERIALPVQKSGKLGVNSVGERVKVMKCPKTKEYIMYMHCRFRLPTKTSLWVTPLQKRLQALMNLKALYCLTANR